MSAVHMVAWGVLKFGDAHDIEILALVRQQLEALGIPLQVATGFKNTRVTYRWTAYKPHRNTIIARGDNFQYVCREIANYLDRKGYDGSTYPIT